MKEFIDAYKHLEKLCSEIYNGQYGITQYITDMENTPLFLSREVSGWNEDLADLKRLRHLRNAMVHDTSYYEEEYTKDDIDFLNDFHLRIMKQQDPLSLCRKNSQARDEKTKREPMPAFTEKEQTTIYVPKKVDITPPRKNNKLAAFVIWLGVSAVILILLYFAGVF